ncbi:transcriptional regulator [Actinopolyspora erythraea]|uniref:Transcriptional regulator n=1 Tax=Actinopolyspora erythraea TaxID=414996 RepID=A0A223RZL6_9ACTN|nr:transcriptional regulator [Actinopolyspora erythraea]
MAVDDVVEVTRWSAVDAESSACGAVSATANDSGGDGCGPDERVTADGPVAPKLSVAAVARRLGVAPATLRTWDRRYGLGPTEHSSGRHRRYGPEDVARLELMQHALLRGASPAEAARYAHATAVRHGGATVAMSAGRPEGDPSVDASPCEPPGGDPEPGPAARSVVDVGEDGAVLLSGVLGEDDAAPVERVDTANTGGRGLRLGGANPLARGLGRAVLALDTFSAQRILRRSVERDGVGVTRSDVLRPVFRALSELRERTGSGSELPRLLEDAAATALRSVMADAPRPSTPRPVLLASATGEQQSTDLLALAAALAHAGVGHRLFAPALPREGLEAAIRRTAPAAVLVWSEYSAFADPRLVTGLPQPRQRVRVFAAGGGWSPEALPEQVEHLDSWERALERLGELVRNTTESQW